jgi:hypothetical protein
VTATLSGLGRGTLEDRRAKMDGCRDRAANLAAACGIAGSTWIGRGNWPGRLGSAGKGECWIKSPT